MAERLTIYWTSGAGFGHEKVITGGKLVPTVNGTTAVIRVHDTDGRLASVHTFTRVDHIDWYPSEPRESGGVPK